MHDLIFALAFIAMVAAPAMVATIGGRKEYNPNPNMPSLPRVSNVKAPLAAPQVRPPVKHKTMEKLPILTYGDLTLPVHNARGMSNR